MGRGRLLMKNLVDVDHSEALCKEIFKDYIANKCSACGAPKGELCYSNAVWIHIERFHLVEKESNA